MVDLDLVRVSAELSGLMFPWSALPHPCNRLLACGGGATGMPFFFACERNGDLFICVRSAAEPTDFLHILDFRGKPSAQAHWGVLKSARWIISETRSHIDACTGRIVCCGHSFGGACSGMVAAVLSCEEQRENVIAICYGPFPILSADLSQSLEGIATSFVLRNDLVPRLSSANIKSLIASFGRRKKSTGDIEISSWAREMMRRESSGKLRSAGNKLRGKLKPLCRQLLVD
jgi:hypothetical protein